MTGPLHGPHAAIHPAACGPARCLSGSVQSETTNAKIMDTSAIEIAQSEKKKSCRQAVLLAAWAVLLGGCSTDFMQNVKSAATEMTTPAPVLGPYDAPQPSPWEAQAEKPVPAPAPASPAKPATFAPAPTAAQHGVEQPRRVSDAKPVAVQPAPVVTVTPTTVTATPPGKGASKLMAPTERNALQVNAREMAAPQPATTVQTDTASTTLATAPVGELILKGPPRQYQSSSPTKWIVLGVLLILAAAGGGFVWFQMQRRAVIVAAAPAKKEKQPEGFEMREPTDVPEAGGHGPDTVLDA
jgi:hypothetical protein